jgi:putative exosortase-associated protein (TIGR04073 family)
MVNIVAILLVLACTIVPSTASAQEAQAPEAIIEKMAFKLARGITNVVTCVAEIPTQTVNTVRDRGAAGYVIGPLKGIGMTFYRGLVGGVEAVFFLVPQPGYYDPMIDPPYVWHGWGEANIEKPAAKTE